MIHPLRVCLWSVVFLIGLTTSPIGAATYWVSTSGASGAGCNASATPLTTTAKSTIAAGVGCLSVGDTLRIRGGDYQVSSRVDVFHLRGSSWSNPTTIEAQPGETVRIYPTGTSAMGIGDSAYLIVRGLIFDGSLGTNALDTNSNKTPGAPVPYAEHLFDVSCSQGQTPSTCSDNILVENNEFTKSPYVVGECARYAHHITYRNNSFHHLGNVENSTIVYSSCSDLLVENNIIHDVTGSWGCWYEPAQDSVHRCTFRNNYLERVGYWWDITANNGSSDGSPGSPRHVQGTWNVRYGGGLYVTRGGGHAIYNNVLVNVVGPLAANYGAYNSLIANNTVYGLPSNNGDFGNTSGAITVGGGSGDASNITVVNNIVYQPGVTGVPPIADISATHNQSFPVNLCSSAATGCTIVGDPRFISAAGGSFLLAAGSPAIGQGVNLNSTFTTDADGTVRGSTWDIGAFEATSGAQPDPVNLLAHWPLTEGAGTSAADTSGNNHPGVLDSPAWSSPGITGPSAFAPTGTQEISVANLTGLSVTTSCSLSAWINMTTVDTGGCAIVSNREGCALYLSSTGQPECWIYNGSAFPVARGTASVLGAAHNLICSYDAQDGSGLRTYVDTVQVANTALTDPINYGLASGAFRIGRDGAAFGGFQCRGLINAVYLYQGRLSAEARQNLYTEQVPSADLAVTHMGWYVANAPEGTSLGPIDTNLSHIISAPLGVRWSITKANPGSLTEYFRPYCRVLSSLGALMLDWTEITNSFGSTGIRMYADSAVSVGTPTSPLLPLGNFTSGAGLYLENPVDTSSPYEAAQRLTIAQGESRELEMRVEFGSPRVAGERIECRPQRENGAPFTSYLGAVP